MRHLDLFSGIGGFALAAEWAFPGIEHTFCEIDPFCQAVLKKHWPEARIFGDIKELTIRRFLADSKSDRRDGRIKGPLHEGPTRERESEPSKTHTQIDLLTGGFPCQPFSSAGRRKGTADDRHLWPEMLRVIRETRPTYVLGENVGGLVTWDGGVVLEMVVSDLEAEDYEVGVFIVPACAVDAPHRRDRVWIAAHAKDDDGGRNAGELPRAHELEASERPQERTPEPGRTDSGGRKDTPHASGARLSQRKQSRSQRAQAEDGAGLEPGATNAHRHASDASRGAGSWSRADAAGHGGERGGTWWQKGEFWSEDWFSVAARLCTLDDGLPNGLARPRGWRNASLKGAGNAIVPQIAYEILKAMLDASSPI